MPGVTADRDAIEEASLAPLPAPSNQKLRTRGRFHIYFPAGCLKVIIPRIAAFEKWARRPGRIADIPSTNVRSFRRIWMGDVSQAEALPQQNARGPMAGATIAALGVVYGDIGTPARSTLSSRL